MTTQSPMNPTKAICQPCETIKCCAMGAARKLPIDPSEDTAPKVMLRLAGDTTRALAASASDRDTLDIAKPISTPMPPRPRPPSKTRTAALPLQRGHWLRTKAFRLFAIN